MFTLCDNIASKSILKPNKKLFSNYTFTCFYEIEDVPENDWTNVINNKNIFLSYSFLSALHKQQSQYFRFRYILIYNRKKPIGIMYFQINDFQASLFGEIIEKQITEFENKNKSIFQKYINYNENKTVMRLVTCGNNLISGEHGFYFNINSKKTAFKIFESVIDFISKAEVLKGKISAIIVKDFYEQGVLNKNFGNCNQFKHFNVEPNMVIDLPNGLLGLTDYIECFSKKYRNRTKAILKSSASLTKKRLQKHEIPLYTVEMYNLYTQVYNNAKFKLIKLSPNYFEDMSKSNIDSFYIDAWFLENRMVSFACGFCLENEVEAHYIGFDYKLNKEYELYQTILYSFIEQAILMQKTKINLGRTASEIKSTVGATPRELICYIKPQNTISKLIMKPFMQFLQPSDWVQRNPFKEK